MDAKKKKTRWRRSSEHMHARIRMLYGESSSTYVANRRCLISLPNYPSQCKSTMHVAPTHELSRHEPPSIGADVTAYAIQLPDKQICAVDQSAFQQSVDMMATSADTNIVY